MRDSWFDYDERLRWQHFAPGERRVYTIRGFDEKPIFMGRRQARGEEPEKGPVLFFEETPQWMRLNDSNRLWLAEHFSSKPSNCIGKKVTIYVGKWEFNGKYGLMLAEAEQTAPTTAVPTGSQTQTQGQSQYLNPERLAYYAKLQKGLKELGGVPPRTGGQRLTPAMLEGFIETVAGEIARRQADSEELLAAAAAQEQETELV